ncbi:lipopolysaccharide biosynthesis protein [Gracilibacillus xinjiangensis]|uniref:Lipopolysaccharide biosynthesis protein n=1 Tax=Gracilibacillus xinjiangensis TaxID=1193282 RepID=A0ABV8WV28_9BACI
MKNVFILVGGTVFAQGLIVLSSPILTRMYTPEAFGILATFISIISILNSVVSLRYELALPLTRTKKELINLFGFNMLLICVVAFVYWILFVCFGEYIFSLLEVEAFINLLIWLIPFTVLFLGFTNNIIYFFIRIERFKSITNIKVSTSIGKVVSQLLLGGISNFSFGLIVGDIIGRIIGALIGSYLMVKTNLKQSYQVVKRYLSIESMKTAAANFKKFPMYSMPAGLINSLSTHLTPIMLTFAYDPVVAGFYALTQRVLGLPSSLVSQSISQVYLHEAPKLLKEDIRHVRNLYLKTAKNLLLFGGIPIILLAVFGEPAFSFIFGEEWSDSGVYMQILALLFIGQFTVVPLSQTLNILGKQHVQLVWDIGRVLVSLATIIIPSKFFYLEAERTLLIFSISMFLLYTVLFFLSLHYLQKKQVASKEEFI